MIKGIKELPRSKKLAIYGIVILVLLPLIWIMLGFPPLAKGMEFRRIMAEHGFPGESPELVADIKYEGANSFYCRDMSVLFYEDQRRVGFRADDDNVYVAKLGAGKEDESNPTAWCVPAVDGVLYTPLDWWTYECMCTLRRDLDYSMHWFSQYHIPAFAVKAPGAGASLNLILEDCHDQDGNPTAGGRFPLALDQAENGWFLFRWDTGDIANRSGYYASLIEWLKSYDFTGLNSSATAYLELTTWDENGNLLDQLTWKLP